MADETNPSAAPASPVDGGTPTAAEAQLAAELLELGDEAAAPATAPADDAAAAPAPAPADDASAAAPVPAPVEPAPAELTPDPAALAAAEASRVIASGALPQPPKDFDAAYEALQAKYDAGEIDGLQFQREQRALSREEGAWTARVAIWQEQQQSAVQRAETDFNTAALAWEAANKEFMANPLRAQAMQQAIAAVDQQQPGLAPADLLGAAQKIAFEAFGYAPAAPADAAAKLAAATAARAPAKVPQTLASAAAAAPIEAASSNATFATLDGRDISSLEDSLARMSDSQIDAYLRDAPGANTAGDR